MIEISFARAFCDEHLEDCYFSYNENTGETIHIGDTADYREAANELEAHGYYYAGHMHQAFVYRSRRSAPINEPLDSWLEAYVEEKANGE
jgi:hypothetical protein